MAKESVKSGNGAAPRQRDHSATPGAKRTMHAGAMRTGLARDVQESGIMRQVKQPDAQSATKDAEPAGPGERLADSRPRASAGGPKGAGKSGPRSTTDRRAERRTGPAISKGQLHQLIRCNPYDLELLALANLALDALADGDYDAECIAECAMRMQEDRS